MARVQDYDRTGTGNDSQLSSYLKTPIEKYLSLATHEGFAFEKLVRQILQECSRKGVGDFSLTEMVSSYWNKAEGGNIEIDVVAVDAEGKKLRRGSCKRNSSAHDAQALAVFDGHVARFLSSKTGQRFGDYTIEKSALCTPFLPNRACPVATIWICLHQHG